MAEREDREDTADILAILEDYIPADNPRKWAKLQSTVTYRRLHLALLREILLELRKSRGARR